MKIGIFGGSFDPIHIGHLIVAQTSIEKCGLDKVVFVPAKVSPFKVDRKSFFSDFDRLEMVRLAVEDNPKFEVSDFEISSNGISYTYITVEYFSEVYSGSDLFLIVGGDSFETFHKWKNYEKILDKVMLIVYPRGDLVFPRELESYRDKVLLLEVPKIGISSTEIRNRLEKGEEIRYFLPCKVYDYILRKGILKV